MSKNFNLLRYDNERTGRTTPLASSHLPNYRKAVIRQAEEVHLPSSDDEGSWRRNWIIFRKHWRLSAGFAATVIVAVLLFTALMKPVYEPSARLEIDPPGAELFRLEGRDTTEANTEYIETQTLQLENDGLAMEVIRKLDLTHNSQFMSKSILSRVLSPLSWVGRKWTDFPGRSRAALSGSTSLTSDEFVALQRFKANLTVNRNTASRLITVKFATHDPELSAAIVNMLQEVFVEKTEDTRHQAIMHASDWLSRQLGDIRVKMEQSNHNLADFQRENSIVDLESDRSTISDQVADLSRQKNAAESERIQLGGYLRQIRDGNLKALPQIQSNPVIQQLTQQLAEKRSQLSEAKAVLGDNHPNLRKLQNGVDELEAQLQLQREATKAQLAATYAATLTREHMIDAEMQGAGKRLSQVAEYTALKREAQINTDLYTRLYERVKDAEIASASRSSNVRVVDQARVLGIPTRPKVLVNLGLGILLALAGAVMLPFIRERVDSRLHDPQDVRRWTGVPSVTVIPFVAAEARLPARRRLIVNGNGRPEVNGAPTMFLRKQPDSAQANALRGIEASVLLSSPSRPPQLLLVASSIPREGKTTVAINLATALAQQGPTCIIDGDLRRSMVASAFNVRSSPGLTEYLTSSATFEEALCPAPDFADLNILPAGNISPDPGMLMQSRRVRDLLYCLRQHYQYVVIDSPPILLYADARALSSLVDGILFIARAGEVTRDAIVRSIELLDQVHSAPILQFIVNGTDELAQPYAKYYEYST